MKYDLYAETCLTNQEIPTHEGMTKEEKECMWVADNYKTKMKKDHKLMTKIIKNYKNNTKNKTKCKNQTKSTKNKNIQKQYIHMNKLAQQTGTKSKNQ